MHSYIKSLKNNKSTGPSSIPNKLFKPLSEPLKSLINLTFSGGKFPAIFKMGKIIPVFKKEYKFEEINYRPISTNKYEMSVTKMSSLVESTVIYKKRLTVNHEILLTKLKHYGIRGASHFFVKDYSILRSKRANHQ